MRRADWFLHLSTQTVRMLSAAHRSFLQQVPDLSAPGASTTDATPGRAALVARICARYDNASSADEIASSLLRVGLHPPHASRHDITDKLVCPAIDAFRTGRIPLREWWSPRDLFVVLLSWYTRSCLQHRGPAATQEELIQRWAVPKADAGGLVTEAQLPLVPDIPPILTVEFADPWRAELSRRPALAVQFGTEMSHVDAEGGMHEDLRDLGKAAARFHVISQMHDAVDSTSLDVSEIRAAFKRALDSYTAYELRSLQPLDDDTQFLRAAVDAVRSIQIMSSAGSNAPVDRYFSHLSIPEWLTEYLISGGGRIGHRSCGPIPYWFVVLDGADVPDHAQAGEGASGLGFGYNEDAAGLAELALTFDVRGERHLAPFRFAEDSVDAALQLALIVVTAFVRVDFFLLHADGRLELLHSGRYDFSETPIFEHVRRASLRGLVPYRHRPSDLTIAWIDEVVAHNAVNGFLASDFAKDEELYDLHLSIDSAEDPAAMSTLVAAREAWLTANDRLARRRLESTNVVSEETAVAQEHADYRFARGAVLPGTAEVAMRTSLIDLVGPVVDADHAVLHLNRSHRSLEGFLCTASSGAPVVSRIPLDSVPLPVIETMFRAWRDGQPESLELVMESIGTSLGEALVDAIGSIGLRHLFISPTGFLNAIPFCIVRLPDGRYLGDAYSISYIPSVRLVRSLLRHDARRGAGEVVAVAFHEENDIPLTSVEVALVAAMHDHVRLLIGQEATPHAVVEAAKGASVLHAACHGTWRLGDAYSSGLHLAAETASDGYLSCARLHRDGDLSNADVVVLSACDTGRAEIQWPAIQSYLGIDGAFLACGAKTVVSSLWEVDDLAGLLFSFAFHRRLSAGGGPHDAFERGVNFLRDGQYLELQDGDADAALVANVFPGWRDQLACVGTDLTHPYYWAAFKLSGLLGTSGESRLGSGR